MSFILFLMCSTAAITGPLFFWLGRQSRDARCRKAIDGQSALHRIALKRAANEAFRDGLRKNILATLARDAMAERRMN